jgi:hypothetical protein
VSRAARITSRLRAAIRPKAGAMCSRTPCQLRAIWSCTRSIGDKLFVACQPSMPSTLLQALDCIVQPKCRTVCGPEQAEEMP